MIAVIGMMLSQTYLKSDTSYQKLISYIKDYIKEENRLRLIYYHYKKPYYCLKDNIKILKASSKLWRRDERVDYGLKKLIKISEHINNNFLNYKLKDMLQLFYFLIGLHEELFYHKERSHEPQNLIWKGRGYSFYNVSSYIINRYEEYLKGERVQLNRERIEMSLCYLLIFLSRLVFSPYLKYKTDVKNEILNKPIKGMIKLDHKINIKNFNEEKFEFCSKVREVFKDKKPMQDVDKKEWSLMVNGGLRMLWWILNISYRLKRDVYRESFQILRRSMLIKDKKRFTSRTFMCRWFEGPYLKDDNGSKWVLY